MAIKLLCQNSECPKMDEKVRVDFQNASHLTTCDVHLSVRVRVRVRSFFVRSQIIGFLEVYCRKNHDFGAMYKVIMSRY